MIGRTLDDRYAMVRLLGQGGMGAVYEARHTGTGRRVAVKVILGEAADDELVRRFQREARAVGAVESEHIAQVFDTGRDRETGAPYIAMEFLEGEDVQSLIDRLGPLPVALALRIGLQACLGLEAAHEAGIVHRDIKPANLFLARKPGGQRVVKLLDFGVAKMSDHNLGNGGMTKSGALLGSPLYMSPEQARGSGAIDARSDIWSLGISLYHALSGHRPNGHLTGLGELVLAICTTPTRWIQEVAPWVPLEVAQVVHRTLVIDPAGRTASAGELAAALRALLDGEAIADVMLVPINADTRASRPSAVPVGAGSHPSVQAGAGSHPSAVPAGAGSRPSAVPAGAGSRPSAVPVGAGSHPSAVPVGAGSHPSAVQAGAGSRPSAVQAGTAPHALSRTAPAMSVGLSGHPESHAPRAPVALLVGGALAAAIAGGVGIYVAVRGGSSPATAAVPPTQVEVPAVPPQVEASVASVAPTQVEARAAPTQVEVPEASATATQVEVPAPPTQVEVPAHGGAEPQRLAAPTPGVQRAPASSAPRAPLAPAAGAASTAPQRTSPAAASSAARLPAPRQSATRPPPAPSRPPRYNDDETSRK